MVPATGVKIENFVGESNPLEPSAFGVRIIGLFTFSPGSVPEVD